MSTVTATCISDDALSVKWSEVPQQPTNVPDKLMGLGNRANVRAAEWSNCNATDYTFVVGITRAKYSSESESEADALCRLADAVEAAVKELRRIIEAE